MVRPGIVPTEISAATRTRPVARGIRCSAAALATLLIFLGSVAASAQNLVLRLDPQKTTVNFLLGDVLHTVRGTFGLKDGSLNFDRTSGKLSGAIVIDAKTGASGNGMRDRKMHREVIESDRFPEISFRPDRVQGTVAPQGSSTVSVHGIFSIHGADHEMTIPAQVEMLPDRWNASLHFSIPYVKWGMKNPSTLFLKVSESVEIDVKTGGTLSNESGAGIIQK